MKLHRLMIAMIVGIGFLGSAIPAIAQLRGEEPGSFLIFPEFDITPPAVTQLRISDVRDPALGGLAYINLQYICPGVGDVCPTVHSREITTFHGTLILDVATELGSSPACTKGYVIAFVENSNQVPISSNTLIGSYRISGVDADDAEAVNAIAVQSSRPPGTELGSLDATGQLVLTFGSGGTVAKGKPANRSPGADYAALPNGLLSDFQAVIATAVPPKRTQLIVLTPTIKAGLPNPTANIALRWWNQFEDEHSTTAQFTCWREFELESISGLFTATGLGTPYGSLRVDSITSGNYSPAILGVIRETGPGPTLRRMYHTGSISSTYSPDPGP